MTSIDDYAFSGCNGIKAIKIPTSVTSVGRYAFSDCNSITDAIVPGWKCGVNFATVRNLVITEGTTDVDNSAFSFSQNLESVLIPEGVTSIGVSAFEGCEKLTSVVLPNTLESIGRLAFYDCDNLTLISLPDDVSQIGQRIGYPERLFMCPADMEWCKDESVYYTGQSSVRSGDPGVAEPYGHRATTISTIFVGKGDGSFWWRVDCEPKADDIDEYYDYAMFSIDGVEISKIAGKTDWEKVEWSIPDSGIHMLSWSFTRDDYDEDESLYENTVWLDDITLHQESVAVEFDANGATGGDLPDKILGALGESVILPMPGNLKKGTMMFVGWSDGDCVYAPGSEYTMPLGGALLVAEWTEFWTFERILNAENVTFTTGGNSEWAGDFDLTHDGIVSLRSGVIADSQSSWVQADFNGKGTISFWTKSAGEFYRGKMCDLLTVTLDGAVVFQGATNDWTNVVVSVINSGNHTVKWTYSKNASRTSDYDCAWLDQVCWMPETGPSDPIPDIGDNPTAQEVAAALTGSTDTRLVECITNAANYNAYRNWAANVKMPDGTEKAGAQAVREAKNAWFSFAVASDKLITELPSSDEVNVDAFALSSESGKFDFTVSVDGVKVGDEALKENLKQVFGIEGSATLDAKDFSSSNVDIEFDTPVDGKVKFTACPKEAGAASFFMKVKLTP